MTELEKDVTGTVKWFNRKRGFGFIAGENGIDYYVNYRDIQMPGYRLLYAEQQVTFDESMDDSDRYNAKNVYPLD